MARPFFRLASDEELARSYAEYRKNDFESLLNIWSKFAEPTRAKLGVLAPFYQRAGWLPSLWNGLAFLASLRAVLRAGRGFRARLKPETRRAIESEFPWLERRHQHVPPGWTPPLEFPPEMAEFVDGGDLDDARARWQLLAALNEVQQASYSQALVTQFDLPELAQHAARERQLAKNYFAHWSPAATETLWRQCILVLDALNAAVFEMMCKRLPAQMIARSIFGARAEWRAFVDNLRQPQWLLEVTP